MVQYTLTLKNQIDNEKFTHILNLQKEQENRPDIFFTKEVCLEIQRELEIKSACKISDRQMKRIIQHWIQDIREGYRDSMITVEFSPFNEADLEDIHESGNRAVSAIIYPSLSDVAPQLGALPPLKI